jgi:prephenate dehydrogenase
MTPADSDDWPRRVTILGVGLLGGSVAMAIKRRCRDCELVGYSRTQAKRDLAVSLGAVDRAAGSIDAACDGADVVVVASPVDQIAAMAILAADATRGDCLITDVGSTKATIVQAVSEHPQANGKFLAAHPIAGSEKTGVAHAVGTLLDDKMIVLTPAHDSPRQLTEKAERFWGLTGGKTVLLSPQDHDAYLAAVSHVPHLMSAAVSRLLPRDAQSLVGSGWRDMTRVAAGDPALWTAICRENRSAISHELERFAQDIRQLQRLLESQDDQALLRWLAEAKEKKDQTL